MKFYGSVLRVKVSDPPFPLAISSTNARKSLVPWTRLSQGLQPLLVVLRVLPPFLPSQDPPCILVLKNT